MEEKKNVASIKEAVQSMIPHGAYVIEGTVTGISPLQITLTNDAKMILSSNSLILPRHLTNYSTMVNISDGSINSTTETGAGTHKHDSGEHEGHSSGDGKHTHEGGSHVHNLATFTLAEAKVTVYNALREGEMVYLLSFNNGKQFYVLDRKG